MTKKLAIRSQAVAERIGTRTPFETYGAMDGHTWNQGSAGWLRGDGADAFYRDVNTLDYIVYIYQTPIAWHTPERGWVVVHRAFSATSGKHQSVARWGVYLSDDARVEYVMVDYHLSPAQYDLLSELHSTPEPHTHIGGQRIRTARALEAKGLIYVNTSTDPGAFVLITDAGEKVFA